ncbi:MAG: PIG-L deacetylase family protein [Thermofilaceae archaeon]
MEGLEGLVSRLSYEEAVKAYLELMREDLSRAFDRVRRVLCVQPHPDDTDIAAGGLVAKLTSRGVEVAYVTLTDGGLGTMDPEMYPEKLALVRRREQEEAARILGVKELVWLGYRDGELQPTLEARRELIRLIRWYKPDMVIAPDPWLTYEVHPDHRAAGILAVEAAFFSAHPHSIPLAEGLKPHPVRYVAFYWTRKPNAIIDVSEYMEVKMKAVRAHQSQYTPALEDSVRAYMRLMGKLIGAAYAEAFKVLNPFMMHSNTFAENV